MRESRTAHEKLVARAEEQLAPKVEVVAQPVSAAAATLQHVQTQKNLMPGFLDDNASHHEVRSSCSTLQVYITTGFRGTPPQIFGHSASLLCTTPGSIRLSTLE